MLVTAIERKLEKLGWQTIAKQSTRLRTPLSNQTPPPCRIRQRPLLHLKQTKLLNRTANQ